MHYPSFSLRRCGGESGSSWAIHCWCIVFPHLIWSYCFCIVNIVSAMQWLISDATVRCIIYYENSQRSLSARCESWANKSWPQSHDFAILKARKYLYAPCFSSSASTMVESALMSRLRRSWAFPQYVFLINLICNCGVS